MNLTNAEQIIKFIGDSEKVTPVKVYIKGQISSLKFNNCKVFGTNISKVVFGDWEYISKVLEDNKEYIEDYVVENDRRNSAIPTLDLLKINARIEPGAIIRDQVTIGDNAIIMMGAVINIGAEIGERTMIDMNAILGGRAIVGKNCHIGAGAVLAGVIEPPSATPVIVEDNVLVGANAVILESVRIGAGAVVAAGAIVTEDVPENAVVAGVPARILKFKDKKTINKTEIINDLRKL